MSAPALSWVASIKVGNQTAKQLLLFYASHNFGKPGFEFKNSTLSEQLEVCERAIRDAHKFLQEKGLIKRIAQYGKDGSQRNTLTYLNIPNEFVDNFFKQKGGEELAAGGGGTSCPPREELAAPLNNNINNKEDNKSFTDYSNSKQTKNKQPFPKAVPQYRYEPTKEAIHRNETKSTVPFYNGGWDGKVTAKEDALNQISHIKNYLRGKGSLPNGQIQSGASAQA